MRADETPSGGSISLERFSPTAKDTCDVCDHIAQHMLAIWFGVSAIILCPVCEGSILQVLLSNYVRRKRRGKRIGFIGNLEKDEELGELGSNVVEAEVSEGGLEALPAVSDEARISKCS